jgi:hypothetical protein
VCGVVELTIVFLEWHLAKAGRFLVLRFGVWYGHASKNARWLIHGFDVRSVEDTKVSSLTIHVWGGSL